MKHDLVDELWLKIFPITLGPGKRLFAEGTIPAEFKVIESDISPAGVIVASYERAGKVRTGSFALDPPPTPNLIAAKQPGERNDEDKTSQPRYAGSGIIIPGGPIPTPGVLFQTPPVC